MAHSPLALGGPAPLALGREAGAPERGAVPGRCHTGTGQASATLTWGFCAVQAHSGESRPLASPLSASCIGFQSAPGGGGGGKGREGVDGTRASGCWTVTGRRGSLVQFLSVSIWEFSSKKVGKAQCSNIQVRTPPGEWGDVQDPEAVRTPVWWQGQDYQT